MLSLGLSLENKPILSLRTGQPVGVALEPLINPDNLKIEGWYADDRFTHDKGILLSQDIREILAQGFVVNDHEAISNPEELIRLRDVIKLSFELIGKPVYTENKNRVGKVSDYSFEREGFFIQKLYVAQSIIKSLGGGNVIVDRSQIIEITQSRIIVKDTVIKQSATQSVVAPSFAS